VFDIAPEVFARSSTENRGGHGSFMADLRVPGIERDERRTLVRDRHGFSLPHRRTRVRGSGRRHVGGYRYEFSRFVVGRSNRVAYQSARDLAEGKSPFSALFLHGPCGVGKTHLLQSVAARVRQENLSARVRYVTGEQFTNEFIMSVQNGQIEAFRQRVRDLDLLIVDDIHFLSNKTATQNEFLCTFDAIGMHGARVVLASDEHPKQIRQFSQRLVSRLMAGMVVGIDTPDADTRREFIDRWASERGFVLHDVAAARLAGQSVRSIRELEGLLNRLEALVRFDRPAADGLGVSREIGMVFVGRLLGEALSEMRATVGIDAVQRVVAERFGLSKGQMQSSSRHQRLVWARSIVTYLAREVTTLSYPEIARSFGRRTHSSFIDANRRVTEAIAQQKSIDALDGGRSVYVADLVDQLRAELSGPAPVGK
jgi:chromosomal replication initiator protein